MSTARNILIREEVKEVTITNSQTQAVSFMFAQNDYGHSKTDGVIGIILYLEEISGTIGTIAIDVIPLDSDGNRPQNESDIKVAILSATTLIEQIKGTDGGYMFEITGLPKCFGVDIDLIHVGTAVIDADVSLMY